MRKLLITGGAGFIGANFTRYWRKKHQFDTIVVLDKLNFAGNLKNLQQLDSFSFFYFIKGDIGNYKLVEEILYQYQIDTIVNFAAETIVDRSISDPDTFITNNIDSTHTLLKAAKNFWLTHPKLRKKHHFHHISTDEVFGSLKEGAAPFTEESRYKPNSPYAASKAAADHLVRTFVVTYGLNATISNCSNNYGPHDYPAKLIPRVIINILTGKKIPIYGDGKQIRDWVHVDDHCRGIEAIIKRGTCGESYNIGGFYKQTTNIDLIKKICKIMDDMFEDNAILRAKYPRSYPAYNIPARFLIKHVTDRPGHDRHYALDPHKISCELDFACKINLEKGLTSTIQWYLENDHWWKPLIPREDKKLTKYPELKYSFEHYAIEQD